MSTVTTRTGLTKPAGAEQVDIGIINANMDLIDQWIGAIVVTAGTIPPNASLFDGAFVIEKVTGVLWCAIKNGGGGFDKYYLPTQPNVWVGTNSTATLTTGTLGIGTNSIGTKTYSRNLTINYAALFTVADATQPSDIQLLLNGTNIKTVRVPTSNGFQLNYAVTLPANTAGSFAVNIVRAAGATCTVTNSPAFSWFTITETPTSP